MHTVVRSYSGKGAKELVDSIEKNKKEIEKLLRSIKGFHHYYLARTADGGFSVSVYHDKDGTDESIRVAKDWIAKNAGNLGVAPPTVLEGSAALHFK
jgi:hypothetical protein